MSLFRIEVVPRTENPAATAAFALLREAGLDALRGVRESRLFDLQGPLAQAQVRALALPLLVDPVAEHARVQSESSPAAPDEPLAFEVHPRPGVMDPAADTTLVELRAAGLPVEAVRTGRRYVAHGELSRAELLAAAARVLANDCIEELIAGASVLRPFPAPPRYEFRLRRLPLRSLDEPGLEKLARDGHLFLSLAEMRAIQEHFRALARDPSDLELETLAQTWSEHCVHKTLKSAVVYRGAAMPRAAQAPAPRDDAPVELHFANLLVDTIARATHELIAQRRGPECLSVFADNAGVIAFDDEFGLAFKVETHNHPSAIEPYGGAATGVGGCIRDVLGCGLGALPIAGTDVFCVAPGDWPSAHLPSGVLHPRRVLRGVVRGVADYGNRMGIPTVNGAIHFDPRYLANPLVYCGCVGLIPRNKLEKRARPGDHIVLIGGRTGRDGIHGATFSSAELTDTHADEFSHAVQIGNAITEKRVLDALMLARDAPGGCLYSAITDCGAGGLSSAVGEMAAELGAVVDLEHAPLKYAGLRYDEIWISEAQERMVLAVPPDRLAAFFEIMRSEEVEATAIGEFGHSGPPAAPGAQRTPALCRAGATPRLQIAYDGTIVGDLDLTFLHDGVPRQTRLAEWQPRPDAAPRSRAAGDAAPAELLKQLAAHLSDPTAAGKEWVIRQYDHEVQGGSVVKPLVGPGAGPGDGAVLTPRLGSTRGFALACGLAPHLFDVDPYWMAIAAIDEAVRNIVCVGGDPRATAILDNFCWGRTDDPRQMGALVRACQACYDGAMAYGTPFISGKDSLNNEFALDQRDIPGLLAQLHEYAQREAALTGRPCLWIAPTEERIRTQRRLAIPGTLLISAVAIVPDVRRALTSDLKQPGATLLLVEGLPQTGLTTEPLTRAARIHHAVADAIAAGLIRSAHDVSSGGWLTAAAEMAIGGRLGFELAHGWHDPFGERLAAYVLETADGDALAQRLAAAGVACSAIARTTADPMIRCGDQSTPLADLKRAWSGPA